MTAAALVLLLVGITVVLWWLITRSVRAVVRADRRLRLFVDSLPHTDRNSGGVPVNPTCK